jgi:hypothetical protein
MPEHHLSKRQRQLVRNRANHCCEYCYTPSKYSPDPFAIEHIIPRSLGGQTELKNLALSCLGCNGYKYNKVEAVDPGGGQTVALFHPRQHLWSEHFAWNETCSHLIGLSPTGRATIETLRLNRPGLINLRRVLYAAGEHPPQLAQ